MVGGHFDADQRAKIMTFALAFSAGLERMRTENYRLKVCIASAIVCIEKLGYPNEDFESFAVKIGRDIYDLEGQAQKSPAATLSSLIETILSAHAAGLR